MPPPDGTAGRGRPKRASAYAAMARSMASSAASACEPLGPPAWAMSGRPPPPLPPSAAAPARTRSTALILFRGCHLCQKRLQDRQRLLREFLRRYVSAPFENLEASVRDVSCQAFGDRQRDHAVVPPPHDQRVHFDLGEPLRELLETIWNDLAARSEQCPDALRRLEGPRVRRHLLLGHRRAIIDDGPKSSPDHETGAKQPDQEATQPRSTRERYERRQFLLVGCAAYQDESVQALFTRVLQSECRDERNRAPKRVPNDRKAPEVEVVDQIDNQIGKLLGAVLPVIGFRCLAEALHVDEYNSPVVREPGSPVAPGERGATETVQQKEGLCRR